MRVLRANGDGTLLVRNFEYKSTGLKEITACPWCGAAGVERRLGEYKVGDMSYTRMTETVFSCLTVIICNTRRIDRTYILYIRSDECRFSSEHLADSEDSI